ncbi:MAG: DUF2953 domain-containing protein [Lachnospiraceae bacterium]|nr:DUF2953 domain-containing protein [Lachnospiraceae bacterium]
MLILKITGLILLGILALVILAALLVLFVPIRYKGTFTKYEEVLKGDGRATWLLGLVCLKIKYEDKEFTRSGRAAFFKIWKEEEVVNKEKPAGPENSEMPERSERSEKKATPVDDDLKTKEEINRPFGKKKKDKKKRKKKKSKSELSVLDRIKNLYFNRDYLEALWDKNEDVILTALKRVKKLLIHILPKKLWGEAEFGFEDPAATGKALGVISAIYGKTGALLDLKPDFQNKVFNCNLHLKGRIRIFTVALAAVLLYFNKDIRKIGERVKRLSEKRQGD